MLRITEVRSGAEAVKLQLEGKVVGEWAAVLESACQPFLTTGTSLILDLDQVHFIDAKGIGVLKQLLAKEISLVNCSSFVRELLQERCNKAADPIV